ncbi:unnamed protein product, partial [Closterium sp. Naga37s-1]
GAGAASSGGAAGAGGAGAAGAGVAGATEARGIGGVGAAGAGGTGATSAGGTRAGGTGAAEAAGAGGAAGAGAGGTGAVGTGGTRAVGTGGAGARGAGGTGAAGADGARAGGTGGAGAGGTGVVLVVSRPPPVPGMHTMALRPSSVPWRVALPSPPASSFPDVPDPESNLALTASPTGTRLLATVVTDPSFESTAAIAPVTELVDFAATRRLDYVASLCLAAVLPRFASLLLCPEGDPNALDIPTPRSYAEAITGPYSSQWQAAMDAEMASWKSTGTYVNAVPPSRANIVDGMWIFIMKRPSGSPPAFKARYVSRGFSQRQGVDFFHTFSPTSKMTTLRVLLHVAAQRDYELHSLDFSTAF